MSKPQHVCNQLYPWLRANLGRHCLAPLTGTDARALQAAVHIIELYSYDGSDHMIVAFGMVVSRMQETTRELAYHSIAMVMDWSDRMPLWIKAGLTPFGSGLL